jgi:hypothetical protein
VNPGDQFKHSPAGSLTRAGGLRARSDGVFDCTADRTVMMGESAMHSLWKRCWGYCCLLAALLLAVSSTPQELRADKPTTTGFTIKAVHDGQMLPDTFAATGAIEDIGTFVEERYRDENFETWVRLKFTGTKGTFYVGWLPTAHLGYVKEKVAHPVEITPGTNAYADQYGTGTLKLRAKWVYGVYSLGYVVVVDRAEYITIKGDVEP